MRALSLSCIITLLIFAVALPTCAAFSTQKQWLLFHIDGKADVVTLESARFIDSDEPCYCGNSSSSAGSGRIVVSYTLPGQENNNNNNNNNNNEHQQKQEQRRCTALIRDPRIQFHDQAHPDHGESHFHGGNTQLDSAHFAVIVPLEANDIHVQLPEDKEAAAETAARRLRRPLHRIDTAHYTRFANTLATALDPSKIVVKEHQVVGTTRNQRNLVFLASGYTAEQQDVFDNDVQDFLTFLQDSDATVSAMPYRRYFWLWNFFSVFHPSAQSGASHPAPAGDGAVSDNILQCSYGPDNSLTLVCSRPSVLVMASYAPPDPSSSLVVVLVNDALFGGTGGGGICTVYNGNKKRTVFMHEIGHAFAELADEYTYGHEEARKLDLINCWYDKKTVPWQDWITAGKIGMPNAQCTFQNYFKPTDGKCIMHSTQPRLCRVCEAATTMTMYGMRTYSATGSNANVEPVYAAHGLNLAAPRFPSEHDTIVVRRGQNITVISANDNNFRFSPGGAWSYRWETTGGTVIATNVSMIGIGNGTVSTAEKTWIIDTPGRYTIYLFITDHSDSFLPAAAANHSLNVSSRNSIYQRHAFRVWVAEPDEFTNCTERINTLINETYCGVCEPGYEAECSLKVSARPLTAVSDVDVQLPDSLLLMVWVGLGILVLGIVAFALVWTTMAWYVDTHVGDIMPLSDTLENLRLSVMIVQVLVLLASTFVIMYSAYMFTVLSIFGRDMVLGICVSACFVWLSSFIAFSAAYFKARKVIFFSFVLALILLSLVLLFSGMLMRTSDTIGSDTDVFIQLQDQWRATVSDHPRRACDFQGALYCSGFENSCIRTVGGTSDCPADCKMANQIAFPCWRKVQAFAGTHFWRAGSGGVSLAALVAISAAVTVMLGAGIKDNRGRIVRERYRRQVGGAAMMLSEKELKLLRRQFEKVVGMVDVEVDEEVEASSDDESQQRIDSHSLGGHSRRSSLLGSGEAEGAASLRRSSLMSGDADAGNLSPRTRSPGNVSPQAAGSMSPQARRAARRVTLLESSGRRTSLGGGDAAGSGSAGVGDGAAAGGAANASGSGGAESLGFMLTSPRGVSIIQEVSFSDAHSKRKKLVKVKKRVLGRISREQFGKFYRSALGSKLTIAQLDEYFDNLDEDGEGSLTFEQFCRIFSGRKMDDDEDEVVPQNLAQMEEMNHIAMRIFRGDLRTASRMTGYGNSGDMSGPNTPPQRGLSFAGWSFAVGGGAASRRASFVAPLSASNSLANMSNLVSGSASFDAARSDRGRRSTTFVVENSPQRRHHQITRRSKPQDESPPLCEIDTADIPMWHGMPSAETGGSAEVSPPPVARRIGGDWDDDSPRDNNTPRDNNVPRDNNSPDRHSDYDDEEASAVPFQRSFRGVRPNASPLMSCSIDSGANANSDILPARSRNESMGGGLRTTDHDGSHNMPLPVRRENTGGGSLCSDSDKELSGKLTFAPDHGVTAAAAAASADNDALAGADGVKATSRDGFANHLGQSADSMILSQ